jgi:hypothetical protein
MGREFYSRDKQNESEYSNAAKNDQLLSSLSVCLFFHLVFLLYDLTM